jgi:hypothetical protein
LASGSIRGAGRFGSSDAEELEHQGQQLAQTVVSQHKPTRYLLAHRLIGVSFGNTVIAAENLQHRQVGNVLAVRDRAPDLDGQPARPAAFEKLKAQAALAGAGLGDDADDLAVAGLGLRPCGTPLESRPRARCTDRHVALLLVALRSLRREDNLKNNGTVWSNFSKWKGVRSVGRF